MDPGDPLLRMETGNAPNTCEMFGIWGRPKCARVKLNHCAGSTYRTLAPRHGFEPRFTAPKAAVLPLDDRGIASRRDCSPSVTVCSPPPQRLLASAATIENGRQSGLVFGTVFKTVRRLLKSLVCSIRTVFRHPPSCRLLYGCSHLLPPKTEPIAAFPASVFNNVNVGRRVRRQGFRIPLGTFSVSSRTFHSLLFCSPWPSLTTLPARRL